MSKISIDNLSDSLKEIINSSGGANEEQINEIVQDALKDYTTKAEVNTTLESTLTDYATKDDLTSFNIIINEDGTTLEDELGDIYTWAQNTQSSIDYFYMALGDGNQLLTQNKESVVGAINELFQNANNGKELIANAIGEPVSSDDTFQAMSDDINDLLVQFKNNMLNSGAVVGSNDKFKQLIDKITTMSNGGGGVQFAEGTSTLEFESNSLGTTTWSKTVNDVGFNAAYIFCFFSYAFISDSSKPHIANAVVSNIGHFSFKESTYHNIIISDITDSGFKISRTSYGYNDNTSSRNFTWYAIGSGEGGSGDNSLAALLKEYLGDTIEEDDTVSEICTKMEESTQYVKDVLTREGVEYEETDKLMDLLEKTDAIGREYVDHQEWVTIANMNTAVGSSAHGVINNRLYCAGGLTHSSGGSSNASRINQSYDPITNTWTNHADMLSARHYIASAVLNDKLYAIGGYYSSMVNKNEVYDPISNSWTSETNIPEAVHSTAASAHGNNIYIFGGINASSSTNAITTARCYDSVAKTWTTVAALPSARYAIGAATYQDRIYLVGGWRYNTYDIGYYYYDIPNNKYVQIPYCNAKRREAPIVIVGDKLHYVGGYPNMTSYEIYNITENTWTTMANYPKNMYYNAIGIIDGSLYVAGGTPNGGSAYNSSYEFVRTIVPSTDIVNLSDSLGIDFEPGTKIAEVCNSIDEMTRYVKESLIEKGINTKEEERLVDLINKMLLYL